MPENKQARQSGEATKKSNIIIKYNQCNSTANCICLSHVATNLLGEEEAREWEEWRWKREGEISLRGENAFAGYAFYGGVVRVVSAIASSRWARRKFDLVYFHLLCSFFVRLSFVGHFPLVAAAATAEAAAAVASSKLKRLLLCRRPLGQVYCDGSHKFHFYLQQLNPPSPLAPTLLFLRPLQAMPRAIICLYTVAATVNGCWR